VRILAYEKAFLALSGLLLAACLGALVYAASVRGVHLPEHDDPIDPEQVATTPPFDRPGVWPVAHGAVAAVVVGRTWFFEPAELRVPRGAQVTFIATSADVIHGLHVAGTRINVMLIPGQVARVTHTFDRPGEYLLVCHEYCGVGHHTMGGKVIVE
jgi:cytochrome c oxidase subunit 2